MSGFAEHGQHLLVLGARQPAQRKGDAEQEQQDGISIADSTPPALKSSHSNGSGCRLIIHGTRQQPDHERRHRGPGRVVARLDQRSRHAGAPDVHDHRLRRGIEERDGVEDDRAER